MRECPNLAPGKSAASLRSDHGPVVLSILLSVAPKERITQLAYSHAQRRLHAIRSDSTGVRDAAATVLWKASDDPALRR